jgi:hypothetical protein
MATTQPVVPVQAPAPAPAPAPTSNLQTTASNWWDSLTKSISNLIPSVPQGAVTTAAAASSNPQAPVVVQPVNVAAPQSNGGMKGGKSKKGLTIPAILLYANPFHRKSSGKRKTQHKKKQGSTKKSRK